jgi:hypothetical protein
MKQAAYFKKLVFFMILLVSLLVSGCGPAKTTVQAVEATKPPEPTATLAPSATPQPTSTPTAVPTDTPTPTPTATATPNRTATAQTVATAKADALLKKIEPDLTTYGYTLADGHLQWAGETNMQIEVKEYGMSRFLPLDAPRGDNFIFQTSVTWNTTGGLAGCGIFFRMEDGTSQGRTNQFVLYRLKSAPAWDISFYDRGQWQKSISRWVYSKSILDKNDATNLVALVVNGRNIYPYINGKKQKLVEDITLEDGLFAVSASQDSGVSTCTFGDMWLWAIDKK